MKKIITCILLICMLLTAVSCSGYSATMLVRSTWDNECKVSFGSLTGVVDIDATVKRTDGYIYYDAELASGEVSVYCKINGGEKQRLFTIHSGEKLEARAAQVAVGDKVTFYIEASEKARDGDFEFDFE